MADKYSKEHPELSKKEVMEHVVEKICGADGVKLFNELVGDKKRVKETIKGQDFSSLQKITESKEFKEASKNVAEDQEMSEENIEKSIESIDQDVCENASAEIVEDIEKGEDMARTNPIGTANKVKKHKNKSKNKKKKRR